MNSSFDSTNRTNTTPCLSPTPYTCLYWPCSLKFLFNFLEKHIFDNHRSWLYNCPFGKKVVGSVKTFCCLSQQQENVPFFSPSQSERFLFYPSGAAVWAQMADDEILPALCTLRGETERRRAEESYIRQGGWVNSVLCCVIVISHHGLSSEYQTQNIWAKVFQLSLMALHLYSVFGTMQYTQHVCLIISATNCFSGNVSGVVLFSWPT